MEGAKAPKLSIRFIKPRSNRPISISRSHFHPQSRLPSMADLLLSVGRPLESVPASYIRPATQRPNLAAVEIDGNIPIVDLGSPNETLIVSQVGQACESYGFFQVVNHGISAELIQQMRAIGNEFFHLPAEEKLRLYSDDPAKKVRLSTSFNVKKETVHNWRDYLRFHCYPLEEYLSVWPSKPSAFRF